MSEPFLAEVKIVGFNFPPRGWAQCDGQILPINQNQSLYSLLGTTYGGDGRTSFALPDLRGRTPMHDDRNQGQKFGQEKVSLTAAESPVHSHGLKGTSGTADSTVGDNSKLLALTAGGRRPLTPYNKAGSTPQPLIGSQVVNTGGQPHENMQPFLALNFVIALQGVFPSRN